jgi:hypothetical protein
MERIRTAVDNQTSEDYWHSLWNEDRRRNCA